MGLQGAEIKYPEKFKKAYQRVKNDKLNATILIFNNDS